MRSLTDVGANSRGDWENRNAIFVDYSQLNSGLAPDGKSIGAICTPDYLTDWENLDEDTYLEKKEFVAQTLIRRLDTLIPGISKHIEHVDVGTPRTIQSYILTPSGIAYGFAQRPNQSGIKRTPFQSPTRNLFFAGAWTFPGGGFTGAILSGYHCAHKVKSSLPRRSEASPSRIEDRRITALIEKRLVVDDTIELTIEKPEAFHYRAGQYVQLELVNQRFKELDMPIRPLSILSHPDVDVLRFAMRTGHSRYKQCVEKLERGDQFRVFGPIGDFFLEQESRKIVLLISGIGVTPIVPMLIDKGVAKSQIKVDDFG